MINKRIENRTRALLETSITSDGRHITDHTEEINAYMAKKSKGELVCNYYTEKPIEMHSFSTRK